MVWLIRDLDRAATGRTGGYTHRTADTSNATRIGRCTQRPYVVVGGSGARRPYDLANGFLA
ncbi:MAG: hypothetical protein OHK0015_28760 [Chloroflexi bacterium OHK40]